MPDRQLDDALQAGISFGLTSGVITTLGLMVGLQSGSQSKLVVVGGILTIAIADASSDALGIHISEESRHISTSREVWLSTIATFVTKLLMALTFLVPVLLMDLQRAVIVSVVWGLSVLALLSYRLAVLGGIKPWKVIGEHLGIACAVIMVTHFVGVWVAKWFQ